MRFKPKTVLALSVLASLTAIVGLGVTLMQLEAPTSAKTAGCTPPARAQVRHELVFGTARAHGVPIREDEWQSFVDSIVTPRFPDGLTVLNASGQWRGEGGLTKEQARILVIWHDRLPSRDADIEAIRSAYKERFDQESVLRIDSVSCVSF
ncbi:DUF3574 domain-containing protein [Bradyrhizobium lablabi]|uniref:DUF3574 domain-containing protein n=1 Tax=Bradyrhizobium lablabi TaxID=722472 RepID=UPI001BA804FD|nr:DUF3574 domain-containing protein [Bradyrhizobium lablabi]MBR1120450.1 DUF3574 domain-containing protein [Bradyrhizobium lablabi]